MKIYEMELKFKADVDLKDVNDTMNSFGFPERLIVKDVIDIKLKMKLPMLPDEEMIQKYCQILKDNYKTSNFVLSDVRFDGYSFVKEVEVEEK